MKRNASKQGAGRKVAKGHKLAPTIPSGTILTDNAKIQWILGNPIGSGGFGCLYSTKSENNSKKEFVLKLEPHENGPLFCEINFYIRSAKSEMIKEWMIVQQISQLGVPNFVASGQLDYLNQKFRFLVMPKFGNDLQKIFDMNGKKFAAHTVFLIGLKMLDILQYIHEKGFTHADIKAANIMTGYKDPENIYLIDYGLAHRYMIDGRQDAYKVDVKWAHNGTIEFTSRDAHAGAKPAPRGDLEIFGFCMWQWLAGSLPWETNLANSQYVYAEKTNYMSNIKKKIYQLIDNQIASTELCNFLYEVSKLEYNDVPNYDSYRNIFMKAVNLLGYKPTDKIKFNSQQFKTSQKKRVASKNEDLTPRENFESPESNRKKMNNNANDINNITPISSETPRSARMRRRILNDNPTTSTADIPIALSSNHARKTSRSINIDNSVSPIRKKKSPSLMKEASVICASSTAATDSAAGLAPTASHVRKVSNKPKRLDDENTPVLNENQNKNPTKSRARLRMAAKAVLVSSASQTSPHLIGLPRSRFTT